ncbi:MAG: ecotin family protein [Akkermansiaceae bacterium]|nr:ecotin family protein [Akkermansiaceae bacterium]
MKMISLLLALLSLPAIAADNMKAFPPAEDGQTRHVIHLPKLPDESLAKVQLIVGKKAMVDDRRHILLGRIEARDMGNVDGWGPTRYVVPKLGPPVPVGDPLRPQALSGEVGPKEERFIPLGDLFLIRYNSRLPVVVYVPKGAEVQYRIWKADAPATTERHEIDCPQGQPGGTDQRVGSKQ